MSVVEQVGCTNMTRPNGNILWLSKTHFCAFHTGQEKATISQFTKEMKTVQQIARKKTLWRGLFNSITQIIPGISYGLALCYGGFMVANGDIHYKYVIR